MQPNLQSAPAPISVAVAYKDPVVRAGLTSILTSEIGFDVSIVTPAWGTSVEAHPEAMSADVVVADYETALTIFDSGRPRAPRACAKVPRVMVVSHRDGESEIRHALDRGAHGYLLLGCRLDEMIDGVRALHRGQRHLGQSAAQRVVESLSYEELTVREGDVLRLVSMGCVNKTIAGELNIAIGTVKAHVKSILAKLGARTRTEAAAIAQRRGLFSFEG